MGWVGDLGYQHRHFPFLPARQKEVPAGEGLSSIDFGVGYTTLRFPFEIVSGDPNGSPGSACSNDPNGSERERARHLQPSDGKVEFKLRDLTLDRIYNSYDNLCFYLFRAPFSVPAGHSTANTRAKCGHNLYLPRFPPNRHNMEILVRQYVCQP